MKRFLVYNVCIATGDIGDVRDGTIRAWYVGKGGAERNVSAPFALIFRDTPDPQFIEQYGYSRKCDAARNWIYKHVYNTEHWKWTAEVVEFDI